MIRLFNTQCSAQEHNIVAEVMYSGNLIMGENVYELERELERFLGKEGLVTCASGTDALMLVIEELCGSPRPGDNIVVPSMTFSATYEAVYRLGFIPNVCDVSQRTDTLRPAVQEQRRASAPTGWKPLPG